MRSLREIQQRVTRVLRAADIRRPPVDVVAVATRLGAEVRPELASDEISGGLYRQGEHSIIGVNANHHPHRQRFTVAHELGHLLLHDNEEFIDHGFLLEEQSEEAQRGHPRFRRDQLSSQALDHREIEANRFAANLLMPEGFVLKAVGRYLPGPIRSEAVEELARTFKVSTQAMTFRLMDLRLPLDV